MNFREDHLMSKFPVEFLSYRSRQIDGHNYRTVFHQVLVLSVEELEDKRFENKVEAIND